ncbi:Trk-type K+ transport system membrane component [Silvibacterium bohemicum]|uniref:Trk-type K+ transport system membrane component n=1 Tax=Silvibacterium bohemicum TaxID=1577686 RepID=A0A841JU99_9BACT|nr:hypothetical protein [Silvibacterium bohemicum]MBB6144730.1 Trk-type K+ transport system membrane component [Silvibacterium bohemicum]
MHILILVAIVAFMLIIAEHTRLASRVAAAEAKLKSIDDKITEAVKTDVTTVFADVKTVEAEIKKAL